MRCPRCHNLIPSDDATCSRCGAISPVGVEGAASGVALAPGVILDGRYEVEALIGCGGMAEVYAGLDRRLKRRVALKVLGADLLQHRTARTRMETEATGLARVVHANVIQIYNAFDHGERLVLDLELVTGGTLATRIPPGGMPVADALRVMSCILSGLAAIHREGLVHRDIKPANILVTLDGLPKIADLGVARDAAGRHMTKTGAPARGGLSRAPRPYFASARSVPRETSTPTGNSILLKTSSGTTRHTTRATRCPTPCRR